MQDDRSTTVAQLKNLVTEFRDDRDRPIGLSRRERPRLSERDAYDMQVKLLFILVLGLVSCSPARAPALYFPAENADWETVSLQASGWKEAALEEALEFARQHNSTAVLILHRGRILAERYWEIDDPPLGRKYRYRFLRVDSTPEGHPIEDVASIQKSVISLLSAVAIEQGLLDRETPVSTYLGAGWSKSPADSEKRFWRSTFSRCRAA